jgi:hypothetical protein
MRPGNLMRLQIVKCLACYDSGEVIDRFDHSKRRRCGCGATRANRLPRPCLAEKAKTNG